ncbi:MAG: tetratricopeptide repeat protein [Muribaculaceae bacterium]|nr:tetratricopeptide repeat protein [Muribaculaceae bacterium]
MKRLYIIFLIAAVGLFMAAGFLAAQNRKAEYIFLEAASAKADGKLDDYYMLLRHAAHIEPLDPYITGALAEIDVQMPDSIFALQAYDKIKNRFYASPDDDEFANAFISAAHTKGRTDDVIQALKLISRIHPDRTTPEAMLADAYSEIAIRNSSKEYADSAATILSELIDRQGFSPALYGRRLSLYAIFKQDSLIERDLRELDASAPADGQIQLFIAQVRLGLNNPDSALVNLERAERLDPSLPDIYTTRAAIFKQRHDSIAYEAEVERAVAMPSIPFDTKIQMWGEYTQTNAADSAKRDVIKRLFTILEEDHPDEPSLHELYGNYLFFINDTIGAVEQFDYATDLDPTDFTSWSQRISAYTRLGDFNKIENVTRQALLRFPDQDDFRALLALSVAVQDRDDEALALADSIQPENVSDIARRWISTVYEIHANNLQTKQAPDSAIAVYKKAIDINPENFSAMNNAAYLMAVRGIDLDEAQVYATLATFADSDNPTYIDTYAWVLFRQNELNKAREQIDRALRIFGVIPPKEGETLPDSADVNPEQLTWELYDHAGDIYYLTGDHTAAIDFWKKALQLKPDNDTLKKKVEHKAYFADENTPANAPEK